MNYKLLLKVNGKLMLFEAAVMVLPFITSLIYRERAGFAFLPVIAVLLIVGALLSAIKPKREELYAREGLAIASTTWIIYSLMGCLPFYISGEIPSFIDSFFETVSGFTTTGASILTDVEALSNCMLFWRSFTHWIGGMGMLVFLLAISKFAGGGYGMNLMRAESPGPSVEKSSPKVSATAKSLYITYTGLTVLMIILLLLGKMPFFDAVVAAFGTAGTGGYGIKNSSIAYYDSYYIQGVITVFMILFGVNFGIYNLIALRKFKKILKDEELFMYFGIIAVAVILITINISSISKSWYDALHHSAFQVAAVISTTGYSTVDFDLWPQFSKSILVLLMLFGASAGSTGGGIKISRILIMLKFVAREVKSSIHPRSVNTLKMNGQRLEDDVVKKVFSFLTFYAILLASAVIVISADGYSFTTNVTAVISALSNIGPGLDAVGPARNYSIYSPLSKFVLSGCMLFGRLEMLPMVILFAPDTWRKR